MLCLIREKTESKGLSVNPLLLSNLQDALPSPLKIVFALLDIKKKKRTPT